MNNLCLTKSLISCIVRNILQQNGDSAKEQFDDFLQKVVKFNKT